MSAIFFFFNVHVPLNATAYVLLCMLYRFENKHQINQVVGFKFKGKILVRHLEVNECIF